MNLRLLLIVVSVFGLMTGCSFLDRVNDTATYVGDATTYVNDMKTYSEQLPVLAEQAVLNASARDSLIQTVDNMKQSVTQFNGLDAPAIAQDVHNKLAGFNETLMTELNAYLEKLTGGVFDLKALQDSQILQTLDSITRTMNVLEQLGQ